MGDYVEPDCNKNMLKKTGETEGKSEFAFNPQAGGGLLGAGEQNPDIKAHHLLVLLLRLRQICCHPGLIKTMIDSEAGVNGGLEDSRSVEEDDDLINQMGGMAIGGKSKQSSVKKDSSDEEEEEEKGDNVLNKNNPIFKDEAVSSKITTLVKELEAIQNRQEEAGGGREHMEKVVVVSQWTSMLNIVKKHLQKIDMKFAEINGQVPTKHRGDIVNDFNRVGRGAQVMLLSLGAGGVGLNLVGANHLFLLDMHWNPQLESQACDRIYRVGQVREVTIHRFLCEATVEARILKLQENKLALAEGILTGAKRAGSNKLTIQEMKQLFDLA